MFEQNWQILSKKDPALASFVKASQEDQVKICQARDGSENLIDHRQEPPTYFYSNYSPQKDADRWINTIENKEVDVIFVYGLGLAYGYEELIPWLEQEGERFLVFLEEDVAVIRAFLHSERAKKILLDPRLHIIYLPPNSLDKGGACEELLHYFIQLSFTVTAQPFYSRTKAQSYCEIKQKIMQYGALVNYASIEMQWHGLHFFQNFYRNLFEMRQVYEIESLKNQFKGVPAIVCGAGPSLNKNFSVLEKLKDKALVFAGGSAIAALSNKGLIPHFGASVDPNPEQFERMFHQSAYSLPMFFKSRVYHKSLRVLHGPKLSIGGANTYPIVKWVEDNLNIKGGDHLKEGFNVIHMLMDLAFYMGCNPVIFVGLDLAFTGMQSYASSVVEESLTDMTHDEITLQSNINDNAFRKKSLYGNEVFTLWKWVSEANYTSKYAQEHPKRKILNCTEGGLGIEGIEHTSLENAAKRYCGLSYDLYGWVQNSIENNVCHRPKKTDVRELLRQLQESLSLCSDMCESEMKLIDDIINEAKQGNIDSVQVLLKELEGLENDLSKQLAYKKIIEPTGRVHSRVTQRKFNKINADSSLPDITKMVKRWQVSKEHLASYKETAKVSSLFIDEAIKLYSQQ
ncbi:MAG: DUF115 domain-containing protein [Chlamydiales bacterium]|nr:DUF115 domain-containing protein [Chlamydiales bacterium]